MAMSERGFGKMRNQISTNKIGLKSQAKSNYLVWMFVFCRGLLVATVLSKALLLLCE